MGRIWKGFVRLGKELVVGTCEHINIFLGSIKCGGGVFLQLALQA
jgi:hypothetical protein